MGDECWILIGIRFGKKEAKFQMAHYNVILLKGVKKPVKNHYLLE